MEALHTSDGSKKLQRSGKINLMKRLKSPTLIVLSMCALVVHVANAETVTIRICRYPGLEELMDKKTVPIARGSSFSEGQDKNGNGGGRFTVVLTEAVKLPPKPECVTAKATLVHNSTGKKLDEKSGMLVAQFNSPGAEIIAHVVN